MFGVKHCRLNVAVVAAGMGLAVTLGQTSLSLKNHFYSCCHGYRYFTILFGFIDEMSRQISQFRKLVKYKAK